MPSNERARAADAGFHAFPARQMSEAITIPLNAAGEFALLIMPVPFGAREMGCVLRFVEMLREQTATEAPSHAE